MKRPSFDTIEKKVVTSILVIDKDGLLTSGILSLFPRDAHVVLVGQKRPPFPEGLSVEYVHFGSLMPRIPDIYYSHIFVVYDGEKDLMTIIPQFLEKARNDDSKIFFLVDLFFAESTLVSDLTYGYRNAYVIVTGDFFGEAVREQEHTINRFFDEANSRGIITVLGDGLTQTFPVLFQDAMEEIIRVAFSAHAPKIAYVFPKHAPTQLSLARIFQTINPFLRIDFIDDERIHKTEQMANARKARNVHASGVYMLQGNYPLLKKIKDAQLLSEENVVDAPKPQSVSKIAPKLRQGFVGQRKKKSFSPLPFLAFFFIALFLAPLFLTLLFAGSGLLGLSFAKDSLLRGDLSNASKSARTSQALFGLSQTTGNIIHLQAGFLGLRKQSEELAHLLELGENGSYALANVISSGQIMLSVFNKTSPAPKEDFINASNKLKKAVTVFQKVRAEKDIPGFSDLDGVITLLSATIDSFPTLVGMDTKKTYLLLFQNNAELRPAGGFIGSYGLLTMDRGSVADFQIHDVYDADGQLKGHVEPAYPFRRYMQVVHQYMRDSNYSPDFPTAASASANMFVMETQQSVSGVIGIDTSFVKTLVEAVGPLYIPDYKETVDGSNFYILTQSHAEKDFFPGSTQKKDFLRSLFLALQLKLTDQKHLPYLALAKAVTRGISEKHILFAFPDASLQHLFSVNNLSSSLLDSRDEKTNQYNDFLGISEANIGANKANAYVYRKIDQKVVLDESGRIKNTVTIRFKNESKDWPGGDYKNYLRVMTTKGSVLTDITIDGQKQAIAAATTDYLLYERKDFTPPSGLEVENSTEMDKTLFGFLVIVPKGTFKTISITYASPVRLDMQKSSVSYDLWYYKQPGTDAYPYSFVFSYPDSFKAFRMSKELSSVGDSVVSESVIVTDQRLHVDVSRK